MSGLQLCLAVVVLLSSSTNEILGSWNKWSRDTINEFKTAKILVGGDRDKAQKLCDIIATDLKRASKASAIEDVMREDYIISVKALAVQISDIVKLKKKYVVATLKTMQRELQNRYSALIGERTAIYNAGRNIDSLKIVLRKCVDASAKTLEPAVHKAFLKKCTDLQQVVDACKEWASNSREIETICTEALEEIDAWILELGG